MNQIFSLIKKAKKATLFFGQFYEKSSTVQSVVEENCDTSSNVGAQQNGLKAFGTQKEGRHGLARLLVRRPENTAAAARAAEEHYLLQAKGCRSSSRCPSPHRHRRCRCRRRRRCRR